MIWPISGPERRHLSEARLLDVALSIATEAEREASQAHIRSCARCASRLAELSAFADNLSAAATADFDDVCSPEHLAGERERIVRRIERLVGCTQSARVLMFPVASHPARPTPARLRHWLAVAAAAGLLAGVTLGQFVRLKPPSEPRAGLPEAIPLISPAPVSPLVLSDTDVLLGDRGDRGDRGDHDEEEAFLEELELSLISLRVSELRVFDELTPRIRDVTVNLW